MPEVIEFDNFGRKQGEVARNLIIGYILFQVLVILASNQITSVDIPIIQWIGNFMGLCLFALAFLARYQMVSRTVYCVALINLVCQIIPVCFYGEHLFDNLKTLGLNINIIATLLYLLVWGAMHNVLFSEIDVEKTLQTILKISFGVSLLTLALDGNKLAYLLTNMNAYAIDFNGIFSNKNMLGSFAAVSLMAGIYLLHVQKKKKLVLIMCVVIAIVLLAALSRAAILAAAVFVLVFTVRRAYASVRFNENRFIKKHGRLIRTFILLAAVVCVILYFRNDMFRQFVVTKLIRSNAGTAGRDIIWRDIISSFDNNALFYLFGMGYSELSVRNAKDCHNIFLYLYATGGLIKSCIYAFLFGKVFHSISKLKQQNVALADFCFSAAIAYLVLGLFETNLLLELGLVNFVYALYALFIPTMYNLVERPINSMAQCR